MLSSSLISVGFGGVGLGVLVVVVPGLESVGFSGSTIGDIGFDCFYFHIFQFGSFWFAALVFRFASWHGLVELLGLAVAGLVVLNSATSSLVAAGFRGIGFYLHLLQIRLPLSLQTLMFLCVYAVVMTINDDY